MNVTFHFILVMVLNCLWKTGKKEVTERDFQGEARDEFRSLFINTFLEIMLTM